MNKIIEVRNEIEKYFDPENIIKDSKECFVSPDKAYKIETNEYRLPKSNLNWSITKVEVFESGIESPIFSFKSNYDQFYYGWVAVDKIDYLLCAEDLYGGQTIIDLSNKKMESYSPGFDGYISTEFHLSPNKKVLATLGCFWACPFEIKLFDFRYPMILPLPEIKCDSILAEGLDFIEWTENSCFKSKLDNGETRIVDISNDYEKYLNEKTV